MNGKNLKNQFFTKFSTFSKNYQKMFAIAKNGVKCQNFDERSQIKVFLDPLISMEMLFFIEIFQFCFCYSLKIDDPPNVGFSFLVTRDHNKTFCAIIFSIFL